MQRQNYMSTVLCQMGGIVGTFIESVFHGCNSDATSASRLVGQLLLQPCRQGRWRHEGEVRKAV